MSPNFTLTCLAVACIILGFLSWRLVGHRLDHERRLQAIELKLGLR